MLSICRAFAERSGYRVDCVNGSDRGLAAAWLGRTEDFRPERICLASTCLLASKCSGLPVRMLDDTQRRAVPHQPRSLVFSAWLTRWGLQRGMIRVVRRTCAGSQRWSFPCKGRLRPRDQSRLLPDGEVHRPPSAASLEPSVAPTALHRPHSSNRFHLVLLTGMLLVALGAGWSAGRYFHRAPAPAQELAQGVNIDAVVDEIIKVELNGDPNAKNNAPAQRASVNFWMRLGCF